MFSEVSVASSTLSMNASSVPKMIFPKPRLVFSLALSAV